MLPRGTKEVVQETISVMYYPRKVDSVDPNIKNNRRRNALPPLLQRRGLTGVSIFPLRVILQTVSGSLSRGHGFPLIGLLL